MPVHAKEKHYFIQLARHFSWLVAFTFSSVAFAMGETTAETVTLSNGQVITINLSAPEEPAKTTSLAYSEAGSNDLIARLRNGFSMNTDVNEERLLRQKQLLAGKQAYLDRVLTRAQRYLYLSVSEAERRQLPTELALLPVIESAYDPMALSRSQAAGLWQFIPDTGRLYGLEQSWYYDARRDPLASTQAAYDYLSKLNNIFNSWELALAAYNAGPGTVSRAIKRNQSLGLPTDYWSLKLPAETMAYVPRFLAIASLFKSPDSFNVKLATIPNRPHFRTITTPGPMTLNEVAEVTGLSPQLIRELNPALRRDSNSPNGPYEWHLPASLDVAIENQLMQSAGNARVIVAKASDTRPMDVANYKPVSDASTANAVPVSFSSDNTRYLVQAGDTWSSIARQFGLSTNAVLAANFAQHTDTLSIGRELSLPIARRLNVSTSDLIQVSEPASDARVEIRRRVIKGDTLASLARQYQVTLAELRAWNGSVQTLQIGQELILRVLPSALSSKAL